MKCVEVILVHKIIQVSGAEVSSFGIIFMDKSALYLVKKINTYTYVHVHAHTRGNAKMLKHVEVQRSTK